MGGEGKRLAVSSSNNEIVRQIIERAKSARGAPHEHPGFVQVPDDQIVPGFSRDGVAPRRSYTPNWWAANGGFVKIDGELDLERHRLAFVRPGASLTIKGEHTHAIVWEVSWRINFSLTEYVEGRLAFSATDLMIAFGPSPEINALVEKRYYADYGMIVLSPGLYQRYADYLNVPAAGTGRERDPNLSMIITPEITAAVTALVAAAPSPASTPTP